MMRQSVAGLALLLALAGLVLLPSADHAKAVSGLSGCWTVPPGVAPPAVSLGIAGIAAPDQDNVWVVGTASGNGLSNQPVIQHWDGTRWEQAGTQLTNQDGLTGVAVASPTNVWAVGGRYPGGHGIGAPLALHWNGRQWQETALPRLPNAKLTGVTAFSDTDVWAVGTSTGSAAEHYVTQGLIFHWDGQTWQLVAIPHLSDLDSLSGITATGSNDIWAVGSSANGPLIEHWDGASWQLSPYPNEGHLLSVAAISPQDVWAVGFTRMFGTVALHWNGEQWTRVPTPNPARRNTLWAVAARKTDDVWAAGNLRLHWDGQQWSENPQINPDGEDHRAVAIDRQGTVWMGDADHTLLQYTAQDCAPVPLPGRTSRTFPATHYTVRGTFLDYWTSHGGLAQQGYPISNVYGEPSGTDGMSYTVQYFERAVFEYHPENRPPYDVLLSLLGVAAYQHRYPSGAPQQQPATENARVFPETGHTLGGRFRRYWDRHGGLAQQGYPLSDEFTEVSALDGKPYTVQYFQRAVFEYHPENAGTPYEILLQQVGTLQLPQLTVGAPYTTR